VLVLGAALWFITIQALVLRQFCPWCMAAHLCGALAAILLLARVPMHEARAKRDNDPTLARATTVRLALAAVAMLALFAVAQAVAPRKTFSVSTIPVSASNTSVFVSAPGLQTNILLANSPSSATGAPSAKPTPPASTNVPAAIVAVTAPALDLFGGRVRLDLTQTPIWGSPRAPLKLVSLFDYTCHHCRDMHAKVVELHRMFGDQLAIVSLPMPLDSQCNSLIRRTSPAQTNACLYARIGLAVWRAKPAAIETFDDWLFGFAHPPALSDVTNKAIELVGASVFETASRDPWIEQQLRADIELFTISAREYRNGSMPQFMIGTNIVTGILTTEQLRAVVAPYAQAVAASAR
ncbi:MAG TPA: thioredoxin domain-containing protein, partial [Candidatus Limnocylindria bacterium]|nr:thioredoxin domain-containing protein [Candidatus Limnocylindria bacterium]